MATPPQTPAARVAPIEGDEAMAYELVRSPQDLDEPVVIEVRNRFDGSWSHGFEVIEVIEAVERDSGVRLRLRRLSDRTILPVLFSAEDVIAYRQT